MVLSILGWGTSWRQGEAGQIQANPAANSEANTYSAPASSAVHRRRSRGGRRSNWGRRRPWGWSSHNGHCWRRCIRKYKLRTIGGRCRQRRWCRLCWKQHDRRSTQPTDLNDRSVSGAFGGAGVGIMVTNAGSAQALQSTTTTWSFDIAFEFGGSIQVSSGNGIWAVSVTLGPGLGLSFTEMNTATAATGGPCGGG